MRRVSDHEIAIKPSPFAKWVVVTAASGVEGASARESTGTKEPQAGRAAVRSSSKSNK